MTTSNPRPSNNSKEKAQHNHHSNGNHQTKTAETDSELLDLETALNDIEKAMDKFETQNSGIQTKLRDLLETNRQITKEFADVRRGIASKSKDVTQQLEKTPSIAHDLAAVTSDKITVIQQDMHSTNDRKNRH